MTITFDAAISTWDACQADHVAIYSGVYAIVIKRAGCTEVGNDRRVLIRRVGVVTRIIGIIIGIDDA
jgi:hypothetical protein